MLGVPSSRPIPGLRPTASASRTATRCVELLRAALRQRPAREWASRLTEARVPAGVVNDIGQAFALARSLGLDPTVSLAREDGGEVSLTRNPVRMSETPPSYRSAPPPLPDTERSRRRRGAGVRNVAGSRRTRPLRLSACTRRQTQWKFSPRSARWTSARSPARLSTYRFPSGSVLVHEGRLLGTFFVIRSGTAEIQQGGCRVGTLGTADCFGEIDPMELNPQEYSVIATSPMRVLTFSAYGIGRLCAAIPGVRNRLLAYLPRAATELRALRDRRSKPGARARALPQAADSLTGHALVR